MSSWQICWRFAMPFTRMIQLHLLCNCFLQREYKRDKNSLPGFWPDNSKTRFFILAYNQTTVWEDFPGLDNGFFHSNFYSLINLGIKSISVQLMMHLKGILLNFIFSLKKWATDNVHLLLDWLFVSKSMQEEVIQDRILFISILENVVVFLDPMTFRGISACWRNGLTWILWSSMKGNAKSCTGDE